MRLGEVALDYTGAGLVAMAGVGGNVLHHPKNALREKPKGKLAAFHGKGTHEVDEVAYSEVENSVQINASQCFKPVPQAVWDFHIGGYRVVEKYLKSRKGRRLTLDEIDHFAATVKALAFTIEQMGRIDLAYYAAFGSSGKASRADDLAAAPM